MGFAGRETFFSVCCTIPSGIQYKGDSKMKLTTRARYGTRALLDIAMCCDQPVQLKRVAERQAISKKYLEQLLAPLRDAGLVLTVRGPAGGYQLARPLEQIPLGKVLSILEGPLQLTECVAEAAHCPRSGICAARQLWIALAHALQQCLDRLTVADLLAIHQQLQQSAPEGPEQVEPPASLDGVPGHCGALRSWQHPSSFHQEQ